MLNSGYHKNVMLSRVLSTLLLFPLTAVVLEAQPAQNPTVVAQKALDLMLHKQFQELQPLFAPAYQSAATPDKLALLAPQPAWGDVKKVGEPSISDMGPVKVVTFPVEFANGNYNFVVFVNPSMQVGQLGFRAGDVPWQGPPYAKAGAFVEKNVTVGENPWTLPGTLTLPVGKGPFPAVVLVHGSGQRDRDETAFGNKVFKDLAQGLASRGIASVRYEKRIKQYAGKMVTSSYTLDDDITDDAAKAAALLRLQPEVNPAKVYILGYEVGGYAAPRIAEADGKLAGIVFFAANERPLEDLYIDQAVATQKPQKYIDGIKLAVQGIRKMDAGDAGDHPPALGLPASYWVDLRGYNPGVMIKGFTGHLMVLAPEKDFQVPMTDFDAWKKALAGHQGVTYKSYPALNHLFMTSQGKAGEDDYKKTDHVAPEVIDDLAKFLQ